VIIMIFNDFAHSQQPALEVFNACLDTVYDTNDLNTEHIHRISPDAKLVYLLWGFDSQVFNGGFWYVFGTSLGDHSEDILKFLRSVGAKTSVRLLEKALSRFPDSKPAKDYDQRQKQLEHIDSDDFIDLDDKYYQDQDQMIELLHQYVRSHTESCVTSH